MVLLLHFHVATWTVHGEKGEKKRGCLQGQGPGPRDSAKQTRARREGKGRREGRKGKRKRRSRPPARKGAVLWRGWIDGSMDREESKRTNGDREGRGTDKIRRGKVMKESYGKLRLKFVLLIAHGEG
jgi:hypothetical protein